MGPLGSAVSMQFQSWSRHLTTLSEASARSAQRHAAAKREFAAAGRNSAVSDRSSAGDPDLLRKLGRKIRRLRLRVHFAAVSLRFLVVLEGETFRRHFADTSQTLPREEA